MNTERSLERIADSLKDIANELKAIRKLNAGAFNTAVKFLEAKYAADDDLDSMIDKLLDEVM